MPFFRTLISLFQQNISVSAGPLSYTVHRLTLCSIKNSPHGGALHNTNPCESGESHPTSIHPSTDPLSAWGQHNSLHAGSPLPSSANVSVVQCGTFFLYYLCPCWPPCTSCVRRRSLFHWTEVLPFPLFSLSWVGTLGLKCILTPIVLYFYSSTFYSTFSTISTLQY